MFFFLFMLCVCMCIFVYACLFILFLMNFFFDFLIRIFIRYFINGKFILSWKAFGIFFVVRICYDINGLDIFNLYLKLFNSFFMFNEDDLDNEDIFGSA